MRPTRLTHAQRRTEAAPLALMIAGWALAVAPVAHPLLAHAVPFLRDGADERWVQHRSGHHPGGPPAPSGHTHAPGAPEHLQLPLLAAAAPAAFRTVLLALRLPPSPAGAAVSLPRRWSEEQPQAP
jgi:hypothetical protein